MIINPTFHTCAAILHFRLDFFYFWSIGAEEDFVMEEIYRTESKSKTKKLLNSVIG